MFLKIMMEHLPISVLSKREFSVNTIYEQISLSVPSRLWDRVMSNGPPSGPSILKVISVQLM